MGIVVLKMARSNTAVFLDVTPYSSVEKTKVSENYPASIFSVKMAAVGF
jgi:hypothetical protein